MHTKHIPWLGSFPPWSVSLVRQSGDRISPVLYIYSEEQCPKLKWATPPTPPAAQWPTNERAVYTGGRRVRAECHRFPQVLSGACISGHACMI